MPIPWYQIQSPGKLNIRSTGSTTDRSLADRHADVVNVKDYGAKGDGSTDDTAAIQAGLTAAQTGKRLIIPDGDYHISDTLAVNFGNGMVVDGAGPYKTTIKWVGAAGGVMLRITNGYRVSLRKLGLEGSDTVSCESLIEMQGNSLLSPPAGPTGCTFEDLRLVGGGGAVTSTYCARFIIAPGSVDQMNDQSRWIRVNFARASIAALSIEHVNSKQHALYDVDMRYCDASGLHIVEGSAHMFGGYFGVVVGAAIKIDYQSTDGFSVIGAGFESAGRLLHVDTAGGGPLFNVVVEGCRYSSASAIVDGTDAGTGLDYNYAILMTSGGSLLVRGNRFGQSGQTTVPLVRLETQRSILADVRGNVFEATNSAALDCVSFGATSGPYLVTKTGNGYQDNAGAKVFMDGTYGPVTAATHNARSSQGPLILVNRAGAVTINLPSTAARGVSFVIKDVSGAAAANNITVAGSGGRLVDGAANVVIATNYGSVTVTTDGANWFTH